jgi:hypothetical protein
MAKNRKYPAIEPEFSEDKKTVYLDANVFQSIIEEACELRDKIKQINEKQKKKIKH